MLRTSLGIQLAPALVACSAPAERQWRGEGDTLATIRLRSVTAFIYAAINATVFYHNRLMLPSGVFVRRFPRWRPRGYILVTVVNQNCILAVPLFIFTNAIIALLLVRTFLLLNCRGRCLFALSARAALLLKTEEK